MREEVRKINAEQDKRNTFQTPLPQPKFFGAKRQLDPLGQQKVLKGVVMQNLYNQPSQLNKLPQDQSMQQIRKQHQTPNINSDKKTTSQRIQNSTLNLFQQLFRKAEQDSKDKNVSYNESRIDSSAKEEFKHEDQQSQLQTPQQDVNINYNLNSNHNTVQSFLNKSGQDNTQTSTPNQQPQGLLQQQLDQNYEKLLKKYLEPNYIGLSKIIEDTAFEDAKNFERILNQYLNPNDPNYEEIKKRVHALRQLNIQKAQVKKLQYDQKINILPFGQSMHHQQIHDFLLKDILPNQNSIQQQQQYDGSQPYFPSGNQGFLVPQSPNVSQTGKYSPNQMKPTLPVIKEEGQLRQYLNNKNGYNNKKNYDDEEESFGDLEIEENADGILEQNKIADFNAHSNNCLLKSSTIDHKFSSHNIESSSIDQLAPNKQDIGNGSLNQMKPANPSSISVNSNSFFMNSKQSNFLHVNSDNSSANKSQNIINENLNSSSNNNPNASINSSIPNQMVHHQIVHRQSMPKTLRKSQFFANSLNVVQNEDDTPNEEANIEGQIDTDEQPINKICYVPTTPGSVYGGSRNIMKHSINQAPFLQYLGNNNNNRIQSVQQPFSQLLQNPMSQSNKSHYNDQNSRPIELQQNLTFNNSQYFNREIQSKSNLSQGRYQPQLTNQIVDEELKDDSQSSLSQQHLKESSKTPVNNRNKKELQIFSLLRQEEKNPTTQKSDSQKFFNITPDQESSNDDCLQQLYKDFNQPHNKMGGILGRKTGGLASFNLNASEEYQNKSSLIGRNSSISGGGHHQCSAIHNTDNRRSSANASAMDDRSGIDYHTAYQSMSDLQDVGKQQNNSGNNNLSWQGQPSSVNDVSNKSFHDIVNKGSNPQIFTEQNLQDQNLNHNSGSELDRQNNYSQELLKPQNSYNLGEYKNQRLVQVNNLRKTLKNNI